MVDPQFATDEAFANAYKELHRLAHALFANQPGQTLQATALVNEAFLRLRSSGDQTAADPAHFRRSAAQAMRHILIDHARGRAREKRGGGRRPAALDSVELCAAGDFERVLAIDDAIERLGQESPEVAEVVRLRFYAGLDVPEVASTVGRSERAVKRDWAFARARLHQLLRDDG